MEFHFTVPELKALKNAVEREIKKAEEYQLDPAEVVELEGLKTRFERRLDEHQQTKNL